MSHFAASVVACALRSTCFVLRVPLALCTAQHYVVVTVPHVAAVAANTRSSLERTTLLFFSLGLLVCPFGVSELHWKIWATTCKPLTKLKYEIWWTDTHTPEKHPLFRTTSQSAVTTLVIFVRENSQCGSVAESRPVSCFSCHLCEPQLQENPATLHLAL